jgi:hypothetical protein
VIDDTTTGPQPALGVGIGITATGPNAARSAGVLHSWPERHQAGPVVQFTSLHSTAVKHELGRRRQLPTARLDPTPTSMLCRVRRRSPDGVG